MGVSKFQSGNSNNHEKGVFGIKLRLTVCTDDGVYGCKCIAVVERVTTDALSKRVTESFCFVKEELCIVGCSEALEECAHGGGEAVVDFVARRPEGVAAGGGESVDLEHGVVGGYGLKGDVAVPSC